MPESFNLTVTVQIWGTGSMEVGIWHASTEEDWQSWIQNSACFPLLAERCASFDENTVRSNKFAIDLPNKSYSNVLETLIWPQSDGCRSIAPIILCSQILSKPLVAEVTSPVSRQRSPWQYVFMVFRFLLWSWHWKLFDLEVILPSSSWISIVN